MTEWYHDFVNTSYTPKPNELLCLFRLEPAEGFGIEDAAGRVASESSVGTWTELTTMPSRVRQLMAKAYEIQGNLVKIAYPPSLFENGNMAQILSSIAGNIFGMKAVPQVFGFGLQQLVEAIDPRAQHAADAVCDGFRMARPFRIEGRQRLQTCPVARTRG